ncbi:hypothetical protein, partial [Streptomyces sp. H27-H5]|uniref:hypothetical protein n=1 Tax=Streptomyces sp. H27-H5 TaxID=2996460 RepID=UPI00226EB68D
RTAEAPHGRLDQQARRPQARRSNDPGTAIEHFTCLDHVDRLRRLDERARLKELERRNRELEMEVSFLKKAVLDSTGQSNSAG